jgi:hypothetical protein
MFHQDLPGGWYYRCHGAKVGPVSTARLRELLASGQVGPRQAVWQEGHQSLVFVPAVAAVSDRLDESSLPLVPKPVS